MPIRAAFEGKPTPKYIYTCVPRILVRQSPVAANGLSGERGLEARWASCPSLVASRPEIAGASLRNPRADLPRVRRTARTGGRPRRSDRCPRDFVSRAAGDSCWPRHAPSPRDDGLSDRSVRTLGNWPGRGGDVVSTARQPKDGLAPWSCQPRRAATPSARGTPTTPAGQTTATLSRQGNYLSSFTSGPARLGVRTPPRRGAEALEGRAVTDRPGVRGTSSSALPAESPPRRARAQIDPLEPSGEREKNERRSEWERIFSCLP